MVDRRRFPPGRSTTNESALSRPAVDEAYFRRRRDAEAENARRKAERYRGDRSPLDLAGKVVVLVDDGVATGATARACLGQFYERFDQVPDEEAMEYLEG